MTREDGETVVREAGFEGTTYAFLEPGTIITGRNHSYYIREHIARGGQCDVYTADFFGDAGDKHRLAVKIVRPQADNEARKELAEMLQREGEILLKLDHPNLVPCRDAGFHEEMPFLVMNYIHGDQLDFWLRKNHDALLETKLRLLSEIADGIAYLHKRKIVHRGIKPSNIVITDNTNAVILDLGVCLLDRRTERQERKLTELGQRIGTPGWWSPEQYFDGKAVDKRSDVYQTGLVTLFMLAGINPYLTAPNPKLIEGNNSIPYPVVKMTKKMLRRSPSTRFHNMKRIASIFRLSRCNLQNETLLTKNQGMVESYSANKARKTGVSFFSVFENKGRSLWLRIYFNRLHILAPLIFLVLMLSVFFISINDAFSVNGLPSYNLESEATLNVDEPFPKRDWSFGLKDEITKLVIPDPPYGNFFPGKKRCWLVGGGANSRLVAETEKQLPFENGMVYLVQPPKSLFGRPEIIDRHSVEPRDFYPDVGFDYIISKILWLENTSSYNGFLILSYSRQGFPNIAVFREYCKNRDVIGSSKIYSNAGGISDVIKVPGDSEGLYSLVFYGNNWRMNKRPVVFKISNYRHPGEMPPFENGLGTTLSLPFDWYVLLPGGQGDGIIQISIEREKEIVEIIDRRSNRIKIDFNNGRILGKPDIPDRLERQKEFWKSLRKAQLYYHDGKLMKAINEIKKYEDIPLGNRGLEVYLYYLLGQWHLRKNDWKASKEYFIAGAEKDPTNIECTLALAEWYHEQGRFEEELEFYEDLGVKDVESHYWLAGKELKAMYLNGMKREAQAEARIFAGKRSNRQTVIHNSLELYAYYSFLSDDMQTVLSALKENRLLLHADNPLTVSLEAMADCALRNSEKYSHHAGRLDQWLTYNILDPKLRAILHEARAEVHAAQNEHGKAEEQLKKALDEIERYGNWYIDLRSVEDRLRAKLNRINTDVFEEL